eukprot:3608760-Pyramimonas_sp.AAC.1
MWDEVAARSKWKASSRFKAKRRGTMLPTLVQRGAITTMLIDNKVQRARAHRDYWLTKPLKLNGKSTKCLMPGIRRGLPESFQFDDTSKMTVVAQK